jgi:hypothetical protein
MASRVRAFVKHTRVASRFDKLSVTPIQQGREGSVSLSLSKATRDVR